MSLQAAPPRNVRKGSALGGGRVGWGRGRAGGVAASDRVVFVLPEAVQEREEPKLFLLLLLPDGPIPEVIPAV